MGEIDADAASRLHECSGRGCAGGEPATGAGRLDRGARCAGCGRDRRAHRRDRRAVRGATARRSQPAPAGRRRRRLPLRDAQSQRVVPGRDRQSRDSRCDRAAARRRLPRDREHLLAQSAARGQHTRRRRVAHRRRSAHSAPARHPVGRSHSVSDLRDRRAHLPEGLPAGVRADRRDSAQPQIGPAAAGRSRVGCGTHMRWPRCGAAAREGGRRGDVRIGRVASALAAVAGRYRTPVPAGSLRASRHCAADPQHRPGQSSVGGSAAARANTAPAHASLGCTTISSTTVE